MPVYPVAAGKASCRVSGCACRDRAPRYASDLTDEQWELLEPRARVVMAGLRQGPGGAPVQHDLRAMLDAIGRVTRYGIEWRVLPVDFPPWTAVYASFERWSERELPRRLQRGRKSKGRKRNIATDCLGLLLMVTVTGAGMQDRDGSIDCSPCSANASPRSALVTWSGTTNADRNITRPWCGGPPSRS